MHSNPSGLLPWSPYTHGYTHTYTHKPLNILLQLCKLVQASESFLLFALVLPRFGGHVASKLPVFQFLQPLREIEGMAIQGRTRKRGRRERKKKRDERWRLVLRELFGGSCLENPHTSVGSICRWPASKLMANQLHSATEKSVFSTAHSLRQKHKPSGE